LKNFVNKPQAVTEAIECLEDEGCQIKQVTGPNEDNIFLVIAKKRYSSKIFEFHIEYHDDDELFYLATQCGKAVPSKKYNFTVDLLNRLNINDMRAAIPASC